MKLFRKKYWIKAVIPRFNTLNSLIGKVLGLCDFAKINLRIFYLDLNLGAELKMWTQIFKFLILLAMGINGALYLAIFFSPPDPDNIGYWFILYFAILPVLGLLGFLALLLRKPLHLSAWVGGILLLYVIPLTLLANSFQLGFAQILGLFPTGTYEVLHLAGFIAACVGLFSVMRSR